MSKTIERQTVERDIVLPPLPVEGAMTDMPLPQDGLRRDLTLLDATMINVGTIIGSGIFFVPNAIAHHLQSSALVLLAWMLGGVVSLLGALSVAELGALMPDAGGQFVYLRKAYGPVVGFLYGWTTFSVINTASIAAVAIAFATYLGYFIPLSPILVKGVAVGSIVLLTAINYLGVKHGARLQNWITFLKIGAMVALIVLSFTLSGGAMSHFSPVLPQLGFAHMAGPFGLAMIAVLWAYDGWIQITYVAGEIKAPQRNIPKALVLSTLMVIGIYSLVNLAYLYVLSLPVMAESKLVASDTAQALMGPVGASLISLAVLVSTFGANNGFILTGARIYYAMAKEGVFFPQAARLHDRWKTPSSALIAQGIWATVLTLTGSFSQLFTYVIFASWIFYAMSSGAVLILRKRYPQWERPYKTWGYPVTPILFILFATWLVVNAIWEAPQDSVIGLGIILLGLPAYFYWNRSHKSSDHVVR